LLPLHVSALLAILKWNIQLIAGRKIRVRQKLTKFGHLMMSVKVSCFEVHLIEQLNFLFRAWRLWLAAVGNVQTLINSTDWVRLVASRVALSSLELVKII
jgi:hypothetical protein